MRTPAPRPPTIAIVVPVHNMARHLFRAVTSVLPQLGSEDELIVVDDGSADLKRLGDLEPLADLFTLLRNPTRRGVSFSRNRGIRHARAEWIKLLDADDVLAPFALDLLRQAAPMPAEVHAVGGGCHRVVDEEYKDYLSDTHESLQRIRERVPMLPSATFVRRSALLETGLFDERIDSEQDWDMWFRLHQRFGLACFATTTDPVCYYWIHRRERARKRRHATVEGMSVREYFRRRYGATVAD